MKKKIKILSIAGISLWIATLLYAASQLTKLRDLDILDVSIEDEEDEWGF
jgi:hypothetical protein